LPPPASWRHKLGYRKATHSLRQGIRDVNISVPF
jgi:hypothetical protein